MKRQRKWPIRLGVLSTRHHPTRELWRHYRELSDIGKMKVHNLLYGEVYRTRADKMFKERVPVRGTGAAGRIPRPLLEARIAQIIRDHKGVQQYEII